MLENVLQNMRSFEATYIEAGDLWKRTRKEIHETYKDPIATSKLNEAKALYESTLQEAREKGVSLAQEEFEKVKNDVMGVITQAVPNDFISTLEALKSSGGNISEIEANAYISKYKGNYTALKSLLNVLKENGIMKQFNIISVDEVIGNINDVMAQVNKFYYGYAPNTYETAIMTHEEGTMTQLNSYLSSFLEGGFYREEQKGDN